MRNKKDIPKDTLSNIYYTTSYVLDHGTEWIREQKHSHVYKKGNQSLHVTTGNDEITLVAIDKDERQHWYTLRGDTPFEDEPEEIIEIAEEMGVLDE